MWQSAWFIGLMPRDDEEEVRPCEINLWQCVSVYLCICLIRIRVRMFLSTHVPGKKDLWYVSATEVSVSIMDILKIGR